MKPSGSETGELRAALIGKIAASNKCALPCACDHWAGPCSNLADEILALVNTRAQPQVDGEAVAWRFRDCVDDRWTYLDDKPFSEHREAQPLFASPPPTSAEVAGLQEQLVNETERADLYANSMDVRTREATIEECAKALEGMEFPAPRKNHRYEFDVKYKMGAAIRALSKA